ncbi:MAG: hypothetical protein ABMA00_20475 [Gemmatimonas sp.]
MILASVACERTLLSPLPPPAAPPLLTAQVISPLGGGPLRVWPSGEVTPLWRFSVTTTVGQVVPGVTIRCQVTGGGSVERIEATTDARGEADCGRWTLSGTLGVNHLIASAENSRPAVVGVEAVRANTDSSDGRYVLERFDGELLPTPYPGNTVMRLVAAELTIRDGRFELRWTVQAPGVSQSAEGRSTGAISLVGLRLSLVIDTPPNISSYFNDSWALALEDGRLLLAGDDEHWPLGFINHEFRRVR